ncbi:hypothetical protein SBRY_10036 [Actinacidiphila bryophytorum]|uniref:Uncharacterized protein n=1 Tax=Actinacidiphila bryophytorum TaxID=1436133 RepID=A0A9W4GWE8_9ACTN|nr:hypothetical protein SBRY_10036 [Actinacidiphila bryophytorum]
MACESARGRQCRGCCRCGRTAGLWQCFGCRCRADHRARREVCGRGCRVECQRDACAALRLQRDGRAELDGRQRRQLGAGARQVHGRHGRLDGQRRQGAAVRLQRHRGPAVDRRQRRAGQHRLRQVPGRDRPVLRQRHPAADMDVHRRGQPEVDAARRLDAAVRRAEHRGGARRQLQPVGVGAAGAGGLARFAHHDLVVAAAGRRRLPGLVLLHRRVGRRHDLLGAGEGRHDAELQLRTLRAARDEHQRQRRRLVAGRHPPDERDAAGGLGDLQRVRRADPPRLRRHLDQAADRAVLPLQRRHRRGRGELAVRRPDHAHRRARRRRHDVDLHDRRVRREHHRPDGQRKHDALRHPVVLQPLQAVLQGRFLQPVVVRQHHQGRARRLLRAHRRAQLRRQDGPAGGGSGPRPPGGSGGLPGRRSRAEDVHRVVVGPRGGVARGLRRARVAGADPLEVGVEHVVQPGLVGGEGAGLLVVAVAEVVPGAGGLEGEAERVVGGVRAVVGRPVEAVGGPGGLVVAGGQPGVVAGRAGLRPAAEHLRLVGGRGARGRGHGEQGGQRQGGRGERECQADAHEGTSGRAWAGPRPQGRAGAGPRGRERAVRGVAGRTGSYGSTREDLTRTWFPGAARR